jgi:hypothetical protein
MRKQKRILPPYHLAAEEKTQNTECGSGGGYLTLTLAELSFATRYRNRQERERSPTPRTSGTALARA